MIRRSPKAGDPSARLKHERVREYLEDLLDTLAPDAPLPSERELAQHLGVARMTVRQAMDRMVRTGQIYRVQGSGSFRARDRLDQPIVLTSFSEDMRARGFLPGAKTINALVEPAFAGVAKRLGIPEGSPVCRLERLRTADGEPMAVERSFVNSELAPGLEDMELEDRSLYALLRERYGLDLHVAEQSVQATLCQGVDAQLLGVADGAPALQFERTSTEAQGRAVEHVRSIYRGDRYRLRMTLAHQ